MYENIKLSIIHLKYIVQGTILRVVSQEIWRAVNQIITKNQGINYSVFNDFVGIYLLFIDIGNLIKNRFGDMQSLETNRCNYGGLRKCQRKGRI